MIRKLLINSWLDIKQHHNLYKSLIQTKKDFVQLYIRFLILIPLSTLFFYLSFINIFFVLFFIYCIALHFIFSMLLMSDYKNVVWISFYIYKYLHKKGVAILKLYNNEY